MSIGRRQFLGRTALAGAAALIAPRAMFSQGPESRVEILINEPIGTVNPNLYSHFVEHLGGVVYDGIWVGEHSKIANVGGVRKALVDQLRTISPPVIRWPGGCFADSYDWRDGIGPPESRPRRTDFWADTKPSLDRAATDGPQRFDPNRFGTNEFIRFCRLVNAAPYI